MSKAQYRPFGEVLNSNKKLKLHELVPNEEYKFYRTDNINFNAVFEIIIGDTLIVKNYVSDKVKDGSVPVRMIPTSWIDYVILEKNFPFK